MVVGCVFVFLKKADLSLFAALVITKNKGPYEF